jgi:hypothetical protein
VRHYYSSTAVQQITSKLADYKNMFVFSQFLWVRVHEYPNWLLSKAVKHWSGLFSMEAWLGWHLLPNSLSSCQNSFPCCCKAEVPDFLLTVIWESLSATRGYPQFLVIWPSLWAISNMAAYFFNVAKEKVSSISLQSSSKMGSYITW